MISPIRLLGVCVGGWLSLAGVQKLVAVESFSLGGSGWQVAADDAKTDSIPATVPGCIHTDLIAAGKIPDPFYRDNEKKLQWIGEKAWTYRRTFDVPGEVLQHQFVHLKCEGLDTLATVRVNGQVVATTNNMFRTYEWDVRPLLHPSGNTVEVSFAVTGPAIRPKGIMAAFPGLGGDFLRKEPCNFGWDWGPKFVTCGVWKPIEIVAYDHARWHDLAIYQDHHEAGKVRLDIDLAADTDGQGTLSAVTTVAFHGQPVASSTQPVVGGEGRATLYVTDPQLWWPNEMGPQNLYDVTVELRDTEGHVVDTIGRRIGLRTVEWVPKTDQHPTGFKVNGKAFFAKGANWIPCETFAPLVTTEKLHQYVADAAAVHMNMLRFWGGGYYEEDALYDACDEAGILVWLDMKFACNNYPAYDAGFMENVRAEAQDNVRRIRHHPCVALWSGNNECIFGVGENWDNGHSSRSDYDRLFAVLLRDQVQELAHGANYTPGSPESGDEHNWSVWHGNAAFESYGRTHGFMSEFGFQSFPEPRTVDTFTTPEDRASAVTPVMRLHQKNGDGHGNEKIVATIEKYFRHPKDFDSTLWVSQMLQAYGIELGVEHWRTDWPHSTGSLIWQYDDCWPVASWSSVDYFGRWKALHYAARRFYAPLMVTGTVDAHTGKASVRVASDRAEATHGTLMWSLTNLGGAEITQGSQAVDVPSGTTSVSAAELDLHDAVEKSGNSNALLWLQFTADDGTTTRNLLTFARFKSLRLLEPGIDVKVASADGGAAVTLTARHPALFAWLELANTDATWSDNFVHLRANEPVTIRMATAKPLSVEQIQAALRVRSLYDTYDPNAAVEGERPVEQGSDGGLVASAAQAEIVGGTATLEDGPNPNIGHWDDLDDFLQWTLKVSKPGTFEVVVDQGMNPISPGGEYTVTVGKETVAGKVVTTKDWQDYTSVPVGEVRIDQAGEVPLVVKATAKPNGFVMNLRSVKLVPKAEATPTP